MADESELHAESTDKTLDPPDVVLSTFLATHPGARRAAGSLRAGAEFAITFAGLAGHWRGYRSDSGELQLEQGQAIDPDFELQVPRAAIDDICSRKDASVGDLGVAFFELMVSRQQERRIHVKVRSGLVKLTRRGWLGLVTLGGPALMVWLGRKGLKGPGAIASALNRLHA